MSEMINRAYYAVIPAQVRYDRALKPNAKLLYGELTALCNQMGYCWASNDYFAKLYGLTAETISRLIGQLEQRGYIRCEMEATDKGSRRRIYAGCFLVEPGGVDKNVKTPLDEKVKTPLDEKVKQNITSNNNTIPPKAPPRGAGRVQASKGQIRPGLEAGAVRGLLGPVPPAGGPGGGGAGMGPAQAGRRPLGGDGPGPAGSNGRGAVEAWNRHSLRLPVAEEPPVGGRAA